MNSNNKPDSLVAACFGMVASFLIIAALSGCGGGAGGGGIDPGNAPDIADAITSADGNKFTISSFKTGLGEFSMIENAPDNAIAASAAYATATLDTIAANATEGTRSVDVNFIAPAANSLGLKVDKSGLANWTPFRYARFDVTTGATAFDGTVVVLSGKAAGDWDLWCQASGNVAANSTGTITLDMDACGATINKATVQRLQLIINGTTAGHFYIDNVRLEKGAPAPAATDIADATASPDSNTFTISSFKTGLSGFVAIDDADHDVTVANAAATLDTTAANATEGGNSVNLTVTELPKVGADPWIGLVSRSNGGLDDWSLYRYLRFSVKTGAVGFGGMVAIKSGSGSDWCGGAWATIPANSSGTVELDLAAPLGKGCTARNLADVRHHLIFTKTPGTYYIDNVRLEKDTAPPPAVSDIADATPSLDGNTFTISSFRTGLGAFSMVENIPNVAPGAVSAVNATATLDTASHATEGTQSADVNFIAPAANPLALSVESNGGVADWSPYRHVIFDVKTGATAFDGKVIVQGGTTPSGWDFHCPSQTSGHVPANSMGTITLDLSTCGATPLNQVTVKRVQLQIDGTTAGHFYVDNVRLKKPDIADRTPSVDTNTYTISSFAGGFGGFWLIENTSNGPIAAKPTNGSAAADSVVTHATDGVQSVDVNFIANPPTVDHELGLAIDGNAGVTDWTPYHYARFDVTTGAIPFNGTVIVQSDSTNWNGWCQASGSVPANSSRTLSLELSSCVLNGSKYIPTDVFRLWLRIDSSTAAGNFYIDNVRLTKN